MWLIELLGNISREIGQIFLQAYAGRASAFNPTV
jgi:hypothetical protein